VEKRTLLGVIFGGAKNAKTECAVVLFVQHVAATRSWTWQHQGHQTMHRLQLFFVAACVATSTLATRHVHRPSGSFRPAHAAGHPNSLNCTWKTIEQPLDHFDKTSKAGTYSERFCIYDKYFKKASAGGFAVVSGDAKAPIFFYTGNESPVEEVRLLIIRVLLHACCCCCF